MIDLEIQRKYFENHVAKFTDYGNIKIVDFKRPDSNQYRIRFLFEEDYCRLHISGDLGELIASNYDNMTFKRFSDFVNNVDYFEINDDDIWIFIDEEGQENICDKAFGRNLGSVYDVVTHWQPLPQPYKPKETPAAGMEHIMSRFTRVE